MGTVELEIIMHWLDKMYWAFIIGLLIIEERGEILILLSPKMKPQKKPTSSHLQRIKTENLHAERQEPCTNIYMLKDRNPPSICMLKRQDPLACETGWSLRAVFKPRPSTVSKLKVQFPKHHQYLQASLTAQDLCLRTHTKENSLSVTHDWEFRSNIQTPGLKFPTVTAPTPGVPEILSEWQCSSRHHRLHEERVWLCLTSLLFS